MEHRSGPIQGNGVVLALAHIHADEDIEVFVSFDCHLLLRS